MLIGGDDFKSGQTKIKSVLVDFLVGAGLKPTSIVSYNHLGNNDGMNLSAPQTFRSKEISKSNVVRSHCFLFTSAPLKCQMHSAGQSSIGPRTPACNSQGIGFSQAPTLMLGLHCPLACSAG